MVRRLVVEARLLLLGLDPDVFHSFYYIPITYYVCSLFYFYAQFFSGNTLACQQLLAISNAAETQCINHEITHNISIGIWIRGYGYGSIRSFPWISEPRPGQGSSGPRHGHNHSSEFQEALYYTIIRKKKRKKDSLIVCDLQLSQPFLT